ncbi:hypothetical protein [Providencia sp. PROV259]|uniref:hypothetical protein n=1 Tax=Providencia sp. PROV259 TaxID=2949947 RepID=UPI00234AC89D|nr:hypothetical protein [Providencia sp. PROV259]
MNYEDILRKAISLAEKSQDNKREIEKVFDSLRMSIENFTNGKVSLLIIEKQRDDDSITHQLSRAARYVAGERAIDIYNAICIYYIQVNKRIEIAEWKMGTEGYPCRIIYSNNREVYCSNKEELEQALAELIGSPDVGEILLRILG